MNKLRLIELKTRKINIIIIKVIKINNKLSP
jgi:hypothetical protein